MKVFGSTTFLILSIAFAASAQRDFDYSFLTTSATLVKTVKEAKWEFKKDTVELNIARTVTKSGNRLTITNAFNTSDQMAFTVTCVGIRTTTPWEGGALVYQTVEGGGDMVITIDPLVPIMVVTTATRTETYK